MYKIIIKSKKQVFKVKHIRSTVKIIAKNKRGLPGIGIPTGGTTGQHYAKKSDADYDGEWVNAGSGSVSSVNGQTGTVVLGADDLDDTSTTNKFATASELSDIASNTSARHTHSNKALLDTYTQTETDLADAVSKKHTAVDISGKQDILSEGAFINGDKTKLDGIATGATANTGDVVGPANSVDNRLAIYNNTTGKLLKQSLWHTNGYDLYNNAAGRVILGQDSSGGQTTIGSGSWNAYVRFNYRPMSSTSYTGLEFVKYPDSSLSPIYRVGVLLNNNNTSDDDFAIRNTAGNKLFYNTQGTSNFTVAGNLAVGGTVDGRDVATDGTKLDGIETGADVTDATNVDSAGATMNTDSTLAGNSYFLDEDTMASDSATKVPSQQSVKAYVDTAMSAVPEIVEGTGIDIQDIGGGAKSVAVDSTLLTTISDSAPKASPTFTGLVTSTDNMLVSNGRFTFDKFFSSPYFTVKNSSADTQPIISLAGSGYNNFAYTKSVVGLWLGAGSTTAPDVNLYRDSANVLKTDDAFVASGTITGSNLSGTNTGDLTEISDSEITVGTGTTLRAMSGRRANKIITTANANASKYVSSQGGGLVTNGSGLYGDNTNFTGYTYLATDKPTGASGSFKTPNTSQNLGTTDEYMAVDPFQRYRYSFSAKQISGSGNFYGAVVPYDVDKLQITPSTYMVQTGTLTTLAVELKAGDTTMTLTDATNWYNGGGSSYLRRAIFWNYTDSTGYTWPAETYSQNNTGYDFWNSGGISGNVVTLKTTYAGVTVPVGTAVSNGSDGSTYMYIGATNVAGPASWTNYSGDFGGAINPNTTAASVYLPISTAYIKAGFVYNTSGSSSYQAFANINLRVTEKLDTDGTLTANSDSVIASQKAVKTYTDKKGVLAYDVFSSSGTWTKPSGAKVVEVYAIGGGGGGGKGTAGSEGTARYGGGGGGAGGLVFASIDATTLTGTVTVTVGTGGSGGTTDGGFNTGGNGTATTFGAYVSGGGGTGGSSGAMVLGYGTGGTAGASSYVSGGGGASGAGAGAYLSMPGVAGHMGGGAGGAGRTAANAYTIAVGGGNSSAGVGGSGGGTTVGTAGTAGTNGTGTNGGAGGGGGGPTAVGGAGGTNGGGGGGGGCAISPATSGNGGAGGAGYCIVVTYG